MKTTGIKTAEKVCAVGCAINNKIILLNNPLNDLLKVLILNIYNPSLFIDNNDLFVFYRL